VACCDDPTEPKKLDRRELIRLQEQYGELVRDLFTANPELVMLKLLQSSNRYLTELAALNAHFPSVRLRAIAMLESPSQPVLERIIARQPDSEFAEAAKKRIRQLAE